MKLGLLRQAVAISSLFIFFTSPAMADAVPTEASVVQVQWSNAAQSQMPSITVKNVRYLPIYYISALLHRTASVARWEGGRQEWAFGDQSSPHPKRHFTVHDDKKGSAQIRFDDHLVESHVPAITHVDPWSGVLTVWIPADDVRRSLKMTKVTRSDSWSEQSVGGNAQWVIQNVEK